MLPLSRSQLNSPGTQCGSSDQRTNAENMNKFRFFLLQGKFRGDKHHHDSDEEEILSQEIISNGAIERPKISPIPGNYLLIPKKLSNM